MHIYIKHTNTTNIELGLIISYGKKPLNWNQEKISLSDLLS